MADNVAVTAGSGTTIAADEVVDGTLGTVKVQYVKIMDGTLDGTAKALVGSNGLAVQATSNDLTASGNITTQNLVPAGTATAASAVLSGTLNGQSTVTIQITGTYTGALSLQGTVDNANWITTGGTPFVDVSSGAYSATIASATKSIFQADCLGFVQVRVTGLAAMTGTATVTMRATTGSGLVALDNSIPAGTAVIGHVINDSGSTTAVTGNVTVVQPTGTNLHAVIDSGTITTVSTVTAVTAISNALPAGANLLGRAVADATAATGGIATTARMASAAASTNATLVKGSAGRVYALSGKNNAAYDVFLVLYDSAANPPVPGTTTIRRKVVCPAGQAFVYDFPVGLTFATGIGYAFTKLVADADTTVLVAADITAFNVDYV